MPGDEGVPNPEPRIRKFARVPIRRDKTFGDAFQLPSGFSSVLVCSRGRHGWRTFPTMPYMRLGHQLYLKHFTSVSDVREIIALSWDTGAKVTLWAKDDHDVSFPADALA